MAIGLISDDALFEEELARLSPNVGPRVNKPIDNLLPTDEPKAIVEDAPPLGRGNTPEVPESVRALAAQNAIEGVPSKVLQSTYGVSASSIAAYKNGATSTASYNQPDQKLKKSNNLFKERIVKKASNRLITALDTITPEEVAKLSPLKASQLAKDMAAIVRDMTPEEKEEKAGAGVQIIFNSPRMSSESDFEVIDAQT